MDSKVPQYQRAVTPTIIDSNASPNLVRGKVLSYNTNIIRGGRVTSVGDKLFGSTNSMPAPSSSPLGATLSPRNTSGSSIDPIQSRSLSGKSVATGPMSGKYGSEGIAGAGVETLATAFSVLPRYDLTPLSNELPSDGIIFAKTKSLPEVLVVFRTTEERLRNPERLNLDRRQLEYCPLLEQEQRLRLLNFQNNSIRSIQNLENLPNLIFLDLYNNKITSLEGPLSTVKGLRVLMAGKNKISTISNLNPLRKLDVLDLHSNEIRLIEGLDGLSDLRVLNLAGNRINVVNNLSSLVSLTELNLRRNNIDSVTGLNHLPALQRVFLSHNSIARLDDVRCLFEVSYLIELSLDGNPVSESNDPQRYRAQLVLGMPGLRHLDLKRVTEEERTNAAALMSLSGQEAVVVSTVETGSDGAVSKSAFGKDTNATRRKDSQTDLTHASQQLVLSDYDCSNSDQQKETGQCGGAGDSSDDGEKSTDEDGGSANRRDDKDSDGINGGNFTKAVSSPNQSVNGGSLLPRTFSLERKGLQKYVSLPPEAAHQSGTSSAGIAHLQGLQPTSAMALASESGTLSSTAGVGKGGIATTSTGLAALARAGKLLNTNNVFDLEIIGPDEKALIAVGDNWEWTSNKRLLQNVTEASLYHMKRSTIVSKFGSNQLMALPALRCMRFVFNDFVSLKSVEFIPMVYGRQLERLTVKSCPLSTACSQETIRSYFIASIPTLIEFNDEAVTVRDREQAETLYGSLLRAHRTIVSDQQKSFCAASTATAMYAHPISGTSKHASKSMQSSLLRTLQQQIQLSSKHSLSQYSSYAEVGGGASSPFLAPSLQCVGSVSLEAMRQSLTNSSEPTVGTSGLSQRALQRRRQFTNFSTAFDDALSKIVLETVLEMKNMSV